MAGKVWIGTLTVDGKEVQRVTSSGKETVCLAVESEVYTRYNIRTLLGKKNTWESTNLPDKVVAKIEYKY